MIFHLTSKKPVLIAGSGIHSAEAEEYLHEFAQKTDIPILTTMNAVDLVQDDLKLGFIGVYGNRIANKIIKKCDLVIAVGARLGLRQIGHVPEYFAPDAHLIRADIDQYELSRSIKAEEEKYLIDAKDFLLKLLEEPIPRYEKWHDCCYKAKGILEHLDREAGNLCVEEIASFLPQNPIVAVDVGQNQCWSAQSCTLKGTSGRLLIGGGYGSMGCGLPYAIGASIAKKGQPIYCITGDGGLQMNIQELQTIVREGLPIKILVINNHALGKISEIQEASYDSRFAQTTSESGYTVPCFEKIARAYGIKGATLSSYDKLHEYKDWLVDDEACLIDIRIPEDSKLIPKVNWDSEEILPRIDEGIEAQIETLLGW